MAGGDCESTAPTATPGHAGGLTRGREEGASLWDAQPGDMDAGREEPPFSPAEDLGPSAWTQGCWPNLRAGASLTLAPEDAPGSRLSQLGQAQRLDPSSNPSLDSCSDLSSELASV